MAPALAVALCLASGYFILASAWPSSAKGTDLALRCSLSIGIGLGLFSAVFFVSRMLQWNHLIVGDLCLTGILATVFILRRTQIHEQTAPNFITEALDLPPWLHRLLTSSFVIALASACYSAALRVIAHPHGDGWDAFAIWNLHARFLFRGGAHWRDGFSSLIPWSHPDYPLLLPASIAHFWVYMGRETPVVRAVVGESFAVATIGLLYGSLRGLRGRNVSMLACLALLSTPFFIEQSAAQYADIPLSFFFLSTVALLTLHSQEPSHAKGLLVLAGLSASFAAWTKNEGQLFLLATLVALTLVAHQKKNKLEHASTDRWKDVAVFLAGTLPVLLMVLWFKHSIAPPGDIFSSPSSMLAKVLAPARYWAILSWYAKGFFRFGRWWIIPGTVLLLVLDFAAANKAGRKTNPACRPIVWILAFTLAGYFAIYLITPYDLYWHLRFSLNRLFLQVWPAGLLLFFSYVSFRSG